MSALELSGAVLAGPSRRHRTGFIVTLRRLASHPSGRIGGVILAIILISGTAPGLIAPYDPYAVDAAGRLASPSAAHWFGTDELGRDLLSRVVHGARFFCLTCLLSTSIGAGIGIPAGLIAGAGSRILDTLIMRVVDVLLAFPYILLILAIVAILGPSIWTAMAAVGIAFIPSYARLARAQVLTIRQEDYVEAMRALGAGPVRILIGTILPNILSPMLVYLTFAMPAAVLAAAALSFLGLGAQPPAAEWGAMLVGARTLLRSAWWAAAAPGCAIFLSVLGLNLLGNALRDVLDPRNAR
jgi:peptide/nickel transport system permease protein